MTLFSFRIAEINNEVASTAQKLLEAIENYRIGQKHRGSQEENVKADVDLTELTSPEALKLFLYDEKR